MIGSVLVANRGEIACRVFRTCRELGLATVAVYSDPDARALHVREADAAVRLPGAAPADTYLRGDLIVKAALAAGADAVHPGYGFLSENAEFARAVQDAGLVWIGPPPEAIEAMASKTRAKELMAAAGVPLLAPVDPEGATEADLPLLLKAAAGGGGRGMRVVRDLAALRAELTAAAAEARSAFGDGEVFAEPYVERGRHVEIQILADAHGTVWALGTRDCSLQRRHQKVIEEAPAPGLPGELRAALHESAVEAARAIGYRGAGTVEFLVAEDGRPYFLEMNTRLQVEHPVTEAVFGLDLVALQIRVAEGVPLPPLPPDPVGHAVEARLYAEDPARDWQPQTGPLHHLSVPGASNAVAAPRPPAWRSAPPPPAGRPESAGPWLRLDAGYGDGDVIGVHYDSMVAKVIAWAPTRAEAIRKLAHALERARVHGPVTNRDLLVRSLRHPDFVAGRLDTGFYDRHLPALTQADATPAPTDGRPQPVALAALAAALADAAARRAGGDALPARIGGWRNVPSQPQVKRYRAEPDGTEHEVRYRLTRDGLDAEGFPGVRLIEAWPTRVTLEVDGVLRRFDVTTYANPAAHGGGPYAGTAPATSPYAGTAPGVASPTVYVDTLTGANDTHRAANDTHRAANDTHRTRPTHPAHATLTALPRFPDPQDRAEPGSLLAPMPGVVVRVADGLVPGDRVTAGQTLLWLEAMKMEHRISAPASGTLTALHAAPGRQVEVGALLAVVNEVMAEATQEEPQS
ncbi:acety-l/propionyl-CoA carboxylase subunit alpha [Streptomyces sp. A3M-1-3]|uniref:ATP-binding protein n=1 Tax=Streptomyces sp. A3M-1-3 TaxID=2962044 RepID=UPI0020B7E842|nr:biotin carboxylase N-terminal domain-containing protein [Streptomyces sp. A3M-1-3]MCP3821877.1 acety-l/propionyl-CoA carboxylase subunit alpha [Streptomyces sp. A3M-1-3]